MILLQIYTVLFAIALAWSNKIAVLKMIDFGASLKEEKEFHRANAVVKIIWAFVWSSIPLIIGHGLIHFFLMFFMILLIEWIVFDPALNLFVHGLKDWEEKMFYIGDTAKTDKLLRKYLGEMAGLWKLLIVSSVILVINFFL